VDGPPLVDDPSLISLDCEMVRDGDDAQMVARLSLVHQDGTTILDAWVQPDRPVARYKTHITGATPARLAEATYSRYEKIKSGLCRKEEFFQTRPAPPPATIMPSMVGSRTIPFPTKDLGSHALTPIKTLTLDNTLRT